MKTKMNVNIIKARIYVHGGKINYYQQQQPVGTSSFDSSISLRIILIFTLVCFVNQFSHTFCQSNYASCKSNGESEELIRTMNKINEVQEFDLNHPATIADHQSHGEHFKIANLSPENYHKHSSSSVLGATYVRQLGPNEEYTTGKTTDTSKTASQFISVLNNQSNTVSNDLVNISRYTTGEQFATNFFINKKHTYNNDKPIVKFNGSLSIENNPVSGENQLNSTRQWTFESKTIRPEALQDQKLQSSSLSKRDIEFKKKNETSFPFGYHRNKSNDGFTSITRQLTNGTFIAKTVDYNAASLRPRFPTKAETSQLIVIASRQNKGKIFKNIQANQMKLLVNSPNGRYFERHKFVPLMPLATLDLLPSSLGLTFDAKRQVLPSVTSDMNSSKAVNGPLKNKIEISIDKVDDKPSRTLDEFLITSASAPSVNEFESTLKQQPEQQQEPIITDFSSEQYALANSSLASLLALTNNLNDDDDNRLERNRDEMPEGNNLDANNTNSLSQIKQRDGKQKPEKPTRLDTNNVSHLDNERFDQSLQSNNQIQRKPNKKANHEELFVGPFKSESEAPPIITLSGVVYKKSGATSSIILRGDHGEDTNGRDNLSTSGSSSASVLSSKTNTTSGRSNAIAKTIKIDNVLKTDNDWPYSTSNILQPATSAVSIDHLLFNPSQKSESVITTNQVGSSDELPSDALLTKGFQFQVPYFVSIDGIRPSFPMSSTLLLASLLVDDNNNEKNTLIHNKQLNPLPVKQITTSNSNDHSILLEALSPELGGSQAQMVSSYSAAFDSMLSQPSSLSQEETRLILPSAKQVEAAGGGDYNTDSSLNAAASNGGYHLNHKDKSGPIVIIQKDVKPMKYHLLRAYLKLRRLLRPFEATYVFPNEPNNFLERGHTRSGARTFGPHITK